MKNSLRRDFVLAFLLIASVLSAVAMLAYRNILSYREDLAAVQKSHDIVDQLDDLLYLVRCAQNAQNEYLLTGKERYLDDYRSANERVQKRITQLQATGWQPPGGSLEQVRATIGSALTQFQKTMRVRKEENLTNALQVMFTGRARGEMEAVVKLLEKAVDHEQSGLQNNVDKAERQEKLTFRVIFLTCAGGLFLLLLVALIIWFDLKRRERLQAALVRAEQKALESSRFKSSFLANMSHEIRTPLNAVTGMSALLMDTRLTDEQLDYADTIQTSSRILLSLINDILDLSKIEAGKLDLEAATFQLSTVRDDVRKLFALNAAEKRVALVFEEENKLPAWVSGDSTRFRQILVNLVSNALKFTSEGMVKVTFASKTEGGRCRLQVAVVDTGVGIPLKSQKHLFESFRQADNSTSRRFGGTGLGLAISRELARKMNGDITFTSVENQGTRFLIEVEMGIAEAPARRNTQEAVAADLAGLNILIAEDNAFNQRLMKRFLSKYGCKLTFVENGEGAFKAVAKHKFDVVLMDCQMPVMDGFTASRMIREAEAGSDKHIPIIALTADAMEGSRQKCRAAGMDFFVSKPIDFNALIDAMNASQKDLSAHAAPPPKKENKVNGTFAIFDPNALRRLAAQLGASGPLMTQELISLFYQAAEDCLPRMRKAAESNDLEALARAAHALRSCAGQVGAQSLFALCQSLEDDGRGDSVERTTRAEEAYRLAKVELRKFQLVEPEGKAA